MPGTFIAKSNINRLSFESDHSREVFADDLKKHPGHKYRIERITPESKNQRGFFEGAVVPLETFFQEGMDHRNWEDCRRVREWLKLEFHAEMVTVNGKVKRVAKSTKNELNKGIIEKIIEYQIDQHGINPDEVLNPKNYKIWRDTIFPYGGPDNWIDYCVNLHQLEIPYYKQGLRPLTPIL